MQIFGTVTRTLSEWFEAAGTRSQNILPRTRNNEGDDWKPNELAQEISELKAENYREIPVGFTKTATVQKLNWKLLPSARKLIQHSAQFSQSTPATRKIVMPPIPEQNTNSEQIAFINQRNSIEAIRIEKYRKGWQKRKNTNTEKYWTSSEK